MTKLIAVIHYLNDSMSIHNAEIAARSGFAGVCLIHMDGQDEKIETVSVAIKREFPDLYVFTNRLAMSPSEMIERDFNLGLDGSWADNPGVTSTHISPVCRDIQTSLKHVWENKPDFKFFGSVAFKTQATDPYPDKAAINASNFGWVATTSGAATGHAPSIEKLQKIKIALGEKPLAVASGISPENANDLLPFVDWAFVATGISSSFYALNKERAELLKSRS